MSVLDPLFRWEALDEAFSDAARVQGMLDFEAALARAEARTGLIPAAAASAIAACCRAEHFDLAALARAAAAAGNLAVPLVARLTERVARDDAEAARFVHWGATSQDAIDTGLVLQLRASLERIDGELARLAGVLARLAREHRASLAVARTWMQQALPTTFGLRVAGWLDAVLRHRARLAEVRGRALALQLGGAVGSLAALGDQGLEVAAAVADELGLVLPLLPWHAHRDRVAEVATTLALLTGTLGKVARDVALGAQTEVGELSEPAGQGRGGSSTLPHKRNPVASAVALAAAARVPALAGTMLAAMGQEGERGLGGWHAEWETLPEVVRLAGGALHHLTDALAGLEVDTARMRENLEASRGLVCAEAVQMALGRGLGRGAAHALVAEACARVRQEGTHLRDVLAADPRVTAHLDAAALARLFEPGAYLGAAGRLVERALAAHDAAAPPGSARG
jgi:3-carboxy-cis,cis-muconate cycloisomerase